MILASEWGKDLIPKGIWGEAAAQKLTHIVTAVCDATMPCQCPRGKTGDMYWWMEDCLSQIKSQSVALTVPAHKMQGRGVTKGRRVPVSSEKATIRRSKQSRWMELCRQVEEESFGQPYKLWKRSGSPHNRANGVGSCEENHRSSIPAAPNPNSHNPGSWGWATTVDGSINRCGSWLSPWQG